MKKAKRIACLLLSMVMCLGILAACGNGGDTPGGTQAPGQTSPGTSQPTTPPTPPSVLPPPEPPPPEAQFVDHLVMASEVINVIDLFNPAFQTAWVVVIGHMFLDGLVYVNLQNEYEPRLAKEWHTDDGRVWTFYLRDDVYFHNGDKFTAHDMKYTWERAIETPGSIPGSQARQMELIEVINDYELRVTLARVNVDFIHNISSPTMGPINRRAYEADPEKGPWIGTGPWVIESFTPAEQVVFVRNENYWGQKPVTEKFTWNYIAEATAQLIMLENGEIQLSGISQTNLPLYRDDDRFQIRSYIMNNSNFIAFNQLKPLMQDVNFRRAVAHAINRQEIVDIAVGGFGAPVEYGLLWGYRSEFKRSDLPQYEFDLNKARELIAASSYNGEEIEIVAAMAHTIATAQVLQQQLAEIGVNARIFNTDPPAFATYTAWGHTGADIVVNSLVWSSLASSIRPAISPGNDANKPNYDNPVITDLLNTATVTVDAAERARLYGEIQRILQDELPYIGTMHMGMNRIEAAGVGGVVYFPNNNWDFSQTYMVKQDG